MFAMPCSVSWPVLPNSLPRCAMRYDSGNKIGAAEAFITRTRLALGPGDSGRLFCYMTSFLEKMDDATLQIIAALCGELLLYGTRIDNSQSVLGLHSRPLGLIAHQNSPQITLESADRLTQEWNRIAVR